jgi:Na+-translocating ferredoxin:NAD+ oxidoreductase RnfG subunit
MRRLSSILALSLFTSSLYAQTVYLKPAEALKLIFKNSKEVVSEKKSLNPGQKSAVEKRLGTKLAPKLAKDEWNFYIARSDGRIDGFALIDNEIGKTEPITFITAITPQGDIKEVEILVYREPIGSEVHDRRFLRQYEGKRGSDPIRVGQDITNISGATMSARAVSNGVKRALALWEVFYGTK